jgi:hypothetical protein
MKLALRILVTALVAALLAVPTATAKPGGGHGKGGGKGKPSWAGGGKSDASAANANGEDGEDRGAPGPPGPLPEQAADNPAKTCAAERALDPAAFLDDYGTNVNKANAFGMCVSGEAQKQDDGEEEPEEEAEQEQEGEEEQEESLLESLEGLNPAHYCFALAGWMAANGGDFAETFGENENNANAHGKCVSSRAEGEDVTPAAQEAVCEAAAAAGGELPEACKPEEEQQAQQEAPVTAELTTLLRLLSF